MIDLTGFLALVNSQLPNIAIFSLMFSIGIGLSIQDFLYVIRKPKAAAIGLVGQIILLPLVGALIRHWLSAGPSYCRWFNDHCGLSRRGDLKCL